MLILADGTASSSHRQRVRSAAPVRREPQSPAHPRLAAGNRRASRGRGVRPGDRQPRHAPAPQGGARPGQTRGDPQRARRRLHVRAVSRLSASRAAFRPAAAPSRRPRRRAAARSPAFAAASARAACSASSRAPAMRAAPFSRCAEAASRCASGAARSAAMSRVALSAKFCTSAGKPAGVGAEQAAQRLRIEQRAGRRLRGCAPAGARSGIQRAERAGQRIERDRLGQEPIHAGGEATRVLALQGVGGDRDQPAARQTGSASSRRIACGQTEPVQHRHVQVEQHDAHDGPSRHSASAAAPSSAMSADRPSSSSWRSITSRLTGWSSATSSRAASRRAPTRPTRMRRGRLGTGRRD